MKYCPTSPDIDKRMNKSTLADVDNTYRFSPEPYILIKDRSITNTIDVRR